VAKISPYRSKWR